MSLLSHGYNFLRSAAGALHDRARLAFDHVGASERGAQTAEYCAILLVVAGMVAALLLAGLPARVSAGVSSAMSQLALPAAPPAEAPPAPPADAPADAPYPQEQEN